MVCMYLCSMAADSDGVSGGGLCGNKSGSCGVVVTCEGDLHDPRFPARLRALLRELRALLAEPHPHTLKVNKVIFEMIIALRCDGSTTTEQTERNQTATQFR